MAHGKKRDTRPCVVHVCAVSASCMGHAKNERHPPMRSLTRPNCICAPAIVSNSSCCARDNDGFMACSSGLASCNAGPGLRESTVARPDIGCMAIVLGVHCVLVLMAGCTTCATPSASGPNTRLAVARSDNVLCVSVRWDSSDATGSPGATPAPAQNATAAARRRPAPRAPPSVCGVGSSCATDTAAKGVWRSTSFARARIDAPTAAAGLSRKRGARADTGGSLAVLGLVPKRVLLYERGVMGVLAGLGLWLLIPPLIPALCDPLISPLLLFGSCSVRPLPICLTLLCKDPSCKGGTLGVVLAAGVGVGLWVFVAGKAMACTSSSRPPWSVATGSPMRAASAVRRCSAQRARASLVWSARCQCSSRDERVRSALSTRGSAPQARHTAHVRALAYTNEARSACVDLRHV